MKHFGYIGLFAFLLLTSTACRQEKNNADTARLERLDSLLTSQPEAVLDSLKLTNTDNLNRYNKAYYQLIEVIAKDKISFNFISDSLINLTVDELFGYSAKQPGNYARSLMYQGVVRYRMQITDSTAYQPLRDANTIFSALTPPDLRNKYLCLYYLAEIHDKNKNYSLARKYLAEASTVARQIGDTSYLYSAYSGIFWIDINRSDYKGAKHYIDTISHYVLSNDEYVISFKNMQSVYFERIGQYNKSLQLEKQILQLKNKQGYQNTLLVNYFNISNAYNRLNQLDSAMKYAVLSIQSIRDTSNLMNHYYYISAAKIAEQLKIWKLSSSGYKTGYEIIKGNIDKNLDTKIFELEKKYNLTEAENKVLRFRNQTVLLIGLILILVLVVFALIQYQIKQKQIKSLIEERNRLLEREKKLLQDKQEVLINENIKNEQELLNKQLVLSFFQQISMQNLEMKNFLYDLKINTYIANNKTIYNKISKECEDYNRKTKINNGNLFSDNKLMTLTRISNKDIAKLNKSERLILLLIAIGVDNLGMAVLFNTSSDSIRNRKSQLKKKIEQNHIHLNQQLRDLI